MDRLTQFVTKTFDSGEDEKSGGESPENGLDLSIKSRVEDEKIVHDDLEEGVDKG